MFNVLFASDNNFAPYLGVALYSLLKNNYKEFDKINVYIFDKNISESNKNKLNKISKEFSNSELIFIPDEGINNILSVKVNATRALSTFSRLFAASLLDDSINKILYLDSDALITGSFKELWEMDISNYSVAGVKDVGPDYVKTVIGLDKDATYINAGVLLINLEKWREINIEDEFIRILEEYNFEIYNNDQSILNLAFQNDILLIDPKFNLMSPFLEKSYKDVIKWNNLKNYYTEDILKNALENPVFLHFVHFINGRPWFIGTNHPCKELYSKYANKTPFKDEVFVEDYRGFRYKFFFSLMNYLPYSLLCLLYKPYRDFFIKYF